MAYIRKTKDVHISPKLLEVLNKISNKSEIAKKLLKTKISKEDLIDDPVDYLTISKKDPSKISYAYPEKLAKIENPDDYWTFKGRVEAKPASAIKKVLKDLTEKELDIFTSAFKAATAQKDFYFVVVEGSDIKKYYNQETYTNDKYGTLSNSCMKYGHCENLFYIYTENPEICKMLVMFDNNNYVLGRAILWNKVINVNTGEELKIMDRIYCVEDAQNLHYFKEWADNNDYIYRKNQKWADCLHFISNGKELFLKLSLKLKETKYRYYPYVDTFKFLDDKTGIISNFLPENNDSIKTLISADGRANEGRLLGYDGYQQTYEHYNSLCKLHYPINGEYIQVNRDITCYSDFQDKYLITQHSRFDELIQDYVLIDEYEQYNDQKLLEKRRKYCADRNGIVDDNPFKRKLPRIVIEQEVIAEDEDYLDEDEDYLDVYQDEWVGDEAYADDEPINRAVEPQPEPQLYGVHHVNNLYDDAAHYYRGIINELRNMNIEQLINVANQEPPPEQ